ncbi:MAG: hypothetical protein GXO07_02075 [Crenarchaeota archaeon]|nr:hypothetical protein [Thermoproteota archaeon]
MRHASEVRSWLRDKPGQPMEPEEVMAAVIGEEWLRYLSTIARNVGVPLEELVVTSILLFPKSATSVDPDALVDDVLFAAKGAGAVGALLKKMRELGKVVPSRAKFYAGSDELSDLLLQVVFDKFDVEVKLMRSNGTVIRKKKVRYEELREAGLDLPATVERDDSLLDLEEVYSDLVEIELL